MGHCGPATRPQLCRFALIEQYRGEEVPQLVHAVFIRPARHSDGAKRWFPPVFVEVLGVYHSATHCADHQAAALRRATGHFPRKSPARPRPDVLAMSSPYVS
jgi:hypothetical protein